MKPSRFLPIFHVFVVFSVLGALLGSGLGVRPAYAAGDVTVTKTADTNDGKCIIDCSLREAIAVASPGDTIDFDAALSNTTIHLASTLTISQNLTIDGSSLTTQIIISGDTDNNGVGDVQVFAITGGATVTLDSLRITKGNTGGGGGGIMQSGGGTLTVTNSTLASNQANGGAAISNHFSTLIITNSTFLSNVAMATGGAIYTSGTTTIANSTFTGNSANNGGVIHIDGAGGTLKNSTLSGNSATTAGAGVYSSVGQLNYANTIIANSTSGGDCVITGTATIGTNTNNLVEDGTCSPAVAADPGLAALAYNGGPTLTFALLLASPALDAGDDAICAATPVNNLDQRGVTRPAANHCDIGAFEYEDTVAPTVVSSLIAGISPVTNASSVAFNVTFSESVSGVDTADFSLTTTGISGAAISGVTGSGATYTVSVGTGSGNGTIRLNIPVSATVTDIAGNVLSGTPFTSGESYTIDKIITLTLDSQASFDGWILESSENSGAGGVGNAADTSFRLGDDASKKQYRAILSFSTLGIPDAAVITSVTLKIRRNTVVGGGNPVSIFQGFVADIKTGYFTNAWVLQTSDFQTAGSKTIGPMSPALVSNWYSLNLTNAKAFINKLSSNAGFTQIRLRFKLDDNNNTKANYLTLFSGNASTGNGPQLVIKYYIP